MKELWEQGPFVWLGVCLLPGLASEGTLCDGKKARAPLDGQRGQDTCGEILACQQ